MPRPFTHDELQRRNAFLQLLQLVAVAADGAPTSLSGALQSALDEVCARTEWTMGHALVPCDDGSGDMVSSGIWHIDGATHRAEVRRRHGGIRFRPGVGVPGRVFATGGAEFIGDLRALSEHDADRMRCSLIDAEHVRALGGFPILVHDKAVGVLEFFSTQPYEVDSVLLDVLTQVGRLLGRVVERTRYEADLMAAREAAEVANAAKTEFMSRMNHELRTPLSAVLGFAGLLQLGKLSGTGEREGVAAIEKAGNHLLALINDILEVSRMEKGALPLSMEPVGVAEIVLDTVSLLAPLAKAGGITLETAVPANAPRQFAFADSRALKQVLLNLGANAIKYNRQGGGVHLSVTSESCDAGDRVRVAVSDTGLGIKPGSLSEIFTPFERLGVGRAIEGTGLGLAIAKQLTEAMGGVLEVQSTVGTGSTFAVVLPSVKGPIAQSEVDTSSPEAASSSGVVARTVLYVEDNVANIELMESIFARQRPNLRLIPTMLGHLALDLAREHTPHLILLDLDLPDIDGTEVLGRLKLDTATRDVPVIIVSADSAPAQIEHTLAAGADGYITKPINVVRLLELVDNAVGDSARSEDVTLMGRRPVHATPPDPGSLQG